MSEVLDQRRSKLELLRPEPAAIAPSAAPHDGRKDPKPLTPSLRGASASARPMARFELRRSQRYARRLFAAVFILGSTAAAAFYCFVVAAPMYVSNVKFSIRGQAESPGASSIIGRAMPGAGGGSPVSAFLDGFAVRDYLLSIDALNQLQKKVDYVSRVRAPKGDLLYQLRGDEPKESVLDFYRRLVKVRFNVAEGIISLDVFAFEPRDAYEIASELTRLAGDFSNEINIRMTEETLRTATEDVRRAEKRYSDARVALAEWRKKNANLDVEANAKMYQDILGELEKQLAGARSELEELRIAGLVSSPRRKVIEDRIASLKEQVTQQNARLTSSNNTTSVVNLLADYQRRNVEQEFAAKSYEISLQSLQNAQSVASARQKHVSIVVSPAVPEKLAFPDPWQIITLTFLASAFLYMIGALTASVIRDNQRSTS